MWPAPKPPDEEQKVHHIKKGKWTPVHGSDDSNFQIFKPVFKANISINWKFLKKPMLPQKFFL